MAFPTTPILDNFNRTENPLSDGTLWFQSSSGISGEGLLQTNGTQALSTQSAGTFAGQCWGTTFSQPNEVYVDIATLPASGSPPQCSVFLNWSNPVGPGNSQPQPNGYKLICSPAASWHLYKSNSGSLTELVGVGGTLSPAWAAGDGWGLSMAAGVLTVWRRHSGTWTALTTYDDSASPYTSGYIGIDTNDSATRLDNFGGGASSGDLQISESESVSVGESASPNIKPGYELIGAPGTAVTGATGAAVTPSWGLGANRTAGNLLLCLFGGWGGSISPATPSGWTLAVLGNTTLCVAGLFWKIASGGDAAPTLAAQSGVNWVGLLFEYSGNLTTAPFDNWTAEEGQPAVLPPVSTGGPDATARELVVTMLAVKYSSASPTGTLAHALNNGVVPLTGDNNAISTTSRYAWAIGMTTTNAVADSDAPVFTATNATDGATVIVSFKLAPLGIAPSITEVAGTSETVTLKRNPEYVIVGSPGATATGASGASVTPSWGAGANRTANNLLLCLVGGWGPSPAPATPSGWTPVLGTDTQTMAGFFYRIATGGDATPTIAAQTGVVWTAILFEYSGNTLSPIDGGTTLSTASSILTPLNMGRIDQGPGELVVAMVAVNYSVATSSTAVTHSLNNGVVPIIGDNNSTSTTAHWAWAIGTTTTNVVQDQDAVTYSATNVGHADLIFASFKLAPLADQINAQEVAGTSEVVSGSPTSFLRDVDNVSTADLVGKTLVSFVQGSETSATSESISEAIVGAAHAADSTTTAEVVAVQLASPGIAVTETVTVQTVGPVSVADVTSVADPAKLGGLATISVTDTVSATDADAAAFPYAAIITEVVATSEAVTVALITAAVASELVVLADSVTVNLITSPITVSEAVGTSETVQAPFPSPISVADTATTSEAATALVIGSYAVVVADATVTSELDVETQVLFVSISESTATSETVRVSYVSDESVSRPDATATADVAQVQFGILSDSEAEQTTLSETLRLTVLHAFEISALEQAISTTEFVVGYSPVITFTFEVSVADVTTTGESARGFMAFVLTDEVVTTTESVSVISPNFQATVQDAAITLEAIDLEGNSNLGAADATTTSESLSVAVVLPFAVIVADATTTSESFNVVRTGLPPFSLSVVETVTTSEFFIVASPPSIVWAIEVSVADTTATSELAAATVYSLICLEATSLQETVRLSPVSSLTATDVARTTEAVTLRLVVAVSEADSTSTSETITSLGVLLVTASDATATLEAVVAYQPTLLVALEDDVSTLEDQVEELSGAGFVPINETAVTYSESVAAYVELPAISQEAVAVKESVALALLVTTNTTDTTTTTEALFLSPETQLNIQEFASTSDAAVVAVATPQVVAVEAMAVFETFAVVLPVIVSVTETASTTETITTASSTSLSALDATSLSETRTTLLSSFTVATDASSTQESVRLNLVSQPLISESVSLTDSPSVQIASVLRSAEATVVSEAAGVQISLQVAVTDLGVTSDQATYSTDTPTTIVDLVLSGDRPSLYMEIALAVVDVAGVADLPQVGPNLPLHISDQTAISEQVLLLPDLLVATSDQTGTGEHILFSGDLYVPLVADGAETADDANGEFTVGWQLAVADVVSVSDRTFAGIARPWGPLLPGYIQPSQREREVETLVNA